MSNKFVDCNFCGVEFVVKFIDEDEELKYCPACGESLDDYILDEDSFAEMDDDTWFELEE